MSRLTTPATTTTRTTTPATTTTGTTTPATTTTGTTTPATTTAGTFSTTISTETKAVLILSTNRPLLIDFEGEREQFSDFWEICEIKFLGNIQNVSEFRYGLDTSVVDGCGVTFRGEFYYFGGRRPDSTQISKIIGCDLTKQGDLTFEFIKGACNTLHVLTDERPGIQSHQPETFQFQWLVITLSRQLF